MGALRSGYPIGTKNSRLGCFFFLFSSIFHPSICGPVVGKHDARMKCLSAKPLATFPVRVRCLSRKPARLRNAVATRDLALFLERHGETGSRDAYRKWAGQDQGSATRRLALRELVLLDFMEGKNADTAADLARYRSAGGDDLTPPSWNSKSPYSTVMIPGPLQLFRANGRLITRHARRGSAACARAKRRHQWL